MGMEMAKQERENALVETLAILMAEGNFGGKWATHYDSLHKDVWRRRARSVIGVIRGELADIIERDRTKVAEGVREIKDAIGRREWMRESRGSMAYDDERYQLEFGAAIDEMLFALAPLEALAADHSNCPEDQKRIANARSQPHTPMSQVRSLCDLSASQEQSS